MEGLKAAKRETLGLGAGLDPAALNARVHGLNCDDTELELRGSRGCGRKRPALAQGFAEWTEPVPLVSDGAYQIAGVKQKQTKPRLSLDGSLQNKSNHILLPWIFLHEKQEIKK